MTKGFYLDSAIWIDIYENRKGYLGEPLGEFGIRLLSIAIDSKDNIIMSDVVYKELNKFFLDEELNGMLSPFESILKVIKMTKEQKAEAISIAAERDLPAGDAAHAIMARDNDLILIARDRHFRQLDDICPHHKPEELI